MTIKSVTLLDSEGEIIVQRNFLGFLAKTDFQLMQSHVLGADIEQPVLRIGGSVFVYHKEDDIHMFAGVTSSGDAMAASFFLVSYVKVMKAFLRTNLRARDIAKDQIMIQELLEEMIDNGDVVTTDPEVLKMFVQSGQPNLKEMEQKQITIQATKQLGYRRPGIRYEKNQIFVDCVEKINCLMSPVGQILHADVQGQVDVNCQLSGMPDCTLALNDRLSDTKTSTRATSTIEGRQSSIVMDDASFHQCVKLSNFQQSRQITFVPPDGKFVLMNFRVSSEVKQPFSLRPIFTAYGRNRAQVILNLKSQFSPKISAEEVSVMIPAPPNLSEAKIDAKVGRARITKTGEFIEWKVGMMSGDQTAELKLELNTSTTVATWDMREWKKPPITMTFEIEMFTASGIEIQNLHVVSQEGYSALKWLKCVTTAGTYAIKW